MRNYIKLALAGYAAGAVCAGLPCAATAQSIEELRINVDELNQKIRILERKSEIEKEASVEKSKTAPSISAGAGGFSFRSADTNFVLKLRGYIQADSRWFFDDHIDGNDTCLLRRVRPIFEGTVFDKYDFRVMLDFGS